MAKCERCSDPIAFQHKNVFGRVEWVCTTCLFGRVKTKTPDGPITRGQIDDALVQLGHGATQPAATLLLRLLAGDSTTIAMGLTE